MKTYACCHRDCAQIISFTHEVDAHYRRTHFSFKCPAGHSQSFKDETDEEAQIRRLKAQKVDLEATIDYYREIVEEQRQEMRSLRARLGWRNHWLSQNGHRLSESTTDMLKRIAA